MIYSFEAVYQAMFYFNMYNAKKVVVSNGIVTIGPTDEMPQWCVDKLMGLGWELQRHGMWEYKHKK